uniref:DUF221-domain-containing protein n=1 Tax=Toxocara canis TaxID=6265 RepID=A0A183V4V6_TOXCA
LSTQVGSLFGTFILDFVPTSTIATIVRGHAIGFGIAYILLFGNEMLLTSLFLSSVITFLLILGLDGTLNRIRFRPLYLLVNSVVFIGGTLGIKVAIGRAVHINDDSSSEFSAYTCEWPVLVVDLWWPDTTSEILAAIGWQKLVTDGVDRHPTHLEPGGRKEAYPEHIFDILRSKFTNFANFHTRLYTCAREFDFLGVDFLTPVSLTLLLPAAVVTAQLLCTYMARFELPFCLTRNGSRNKQYAEFVSQAIGRRISIGLHRFILVALVAMMAVKGVQNIQKQRGIQGEYSNPEQEKLFEWIVKNTRSDAVFAGTMPVMANVKLSTNRPIVNHPHYEDAMLRARTLKVYSMYSKKPLSEVHAALKDMRVEYFVYQPELCIPHPTKPECSYRSIWDLEDPKNIDRESLCDVYERAFMTRNFTILNPFKLVYSARAYAVFKL